MNEELERILASMPEHNTIAEHNEIKAQLQSLLQQGRIDELLWVASLDSEGDWKSEIDAHLRQLREGDK